jgi:RNA polymerase sigma-70 factor (ECF subfamily)
MGMGSSPPPSPPPPVAGKTFERLVRGNTALVRRLVRRTGVREANEKDVIQEVFLALHLAIGRGLDVATSLRVWITKTTHRIARDHLKLACNARELLTKEGDIDSQDQGASPEDHMEKIDVRRLIDEVLDELPSSLRLMLVMSDGEDMPMSEIAEVLEIPVTTGYSRLHAARRQFASAWEKHREEQAPHAAAYGIAPILLFLDRGIPELPDGYEDQVWNRLVDTLGPGLSWGGAAPVVVATAGAAAATGAALGAIKSAGVLLTATQIVLGVVASALAGAGIHALIAALRADPSLATIRNDNLPVALAFPQPSNASPSPLPSAPATETTSPAPEASAPLDQELIERTVLERARGALGRATIAPNAQVREQEIAKARAVIAEHERRFPGAEHAEDRDLLRRQILAYQTALKALKKGHP